MSQFLKKKNYPKPKDQAGFAKFLKVLKDESGNKTKETES